MKLYEELKYRGYIDQITSNEIIHQLNEKQLKFYVGFDPTSDSLHIGSLSILNAMNLLQRYGHQPICLIGGATGAIGDPSGKSQERNLTTNSQIQKNIQGIEKQMSLFLNSENNALLLNNHDWICKFFVLDFLRDIGKHFSVNAMMSRDSVKSRLSREGSGISYTEFSYMILQAYDFYYLNKNHNCTLQIGGSDQWGNIVSGIDLIRRLNQKQAYGLTIPLLTKSDGTKFGKTESGTIWLSKEKTSPYEFYQYFLRQSDEDVIYFLKVLTLVSLDEIKELELSVQKEPHLRKAQKKLAEELTEKIHGKEVLYAVQKASQILFGAKIEHLDDSMIQEIFKDVPSFQKPYSSLVTGWNLVDALHESNACKSKGQARKLIQSGGVYVNNFQETNLEKVLTHDDLASKQFLILRTGKRNYRMIQFLK